MAGYIWQTWLADAFRAAGLRVVEIEGWQNRGRPASSGGFDPFALAVHHTGATSKPHDWAPGLTTLIAGRSDLPGPLCQYAVDYGGTVYVIAAGRANHAGRNRGVPNIPAGDGNRDLLGNEVITDGTQQMPADQLHAVAVTSAVVLDRLRRPVDGYLYRHADTSVTGKWDIGQLSTPRLRELTNAAAVRLGAPLPAPTPAQEDPAMVFITHPETATWWLYDGFRKRSLGAGENQRLVDLGLVRDPAPKMLHPAVIAAIPDAA